jgi:hypothetical protein
MLMLRLSFFADLTYSYMLMLRLSFFADLTYSYMLMLRLSFLLDLRYFLHIGRRGTRLSFFLLDLTYFHIVNADVKRKKIVIG